MVVADYASVVEMEAFCLWIMNLFLVMETYAFISDIDIWCTDYVFLADSVNGLAYAVGCASVCSF